MIANACNFAATILNIACIIDIAIILGGLVSAPNRGLRISPIISQEQVPEVFDERCVNARAKTAGLPKNANLEVFGNEIRRAVCQYLAEVQATNANGIRREIEKLYKAARRQRYEIAAQLIGGLSPAARQFLAAANPTIQIPAAESFLNGETREEACLQAEQLTSFGGQWVEGRLRSTGRRSKKWQPFLFAPPASAQFAKREAERDFVVNIRLAYREACDDTEPPPAATTRLVRKEENVFMVSGGFGRMIADCLRLVGAPHAHAVNVMNELHRRRRLLNKRS
jgi:hypothetical protein